MRFANPHINRHLSLTLVLLGSLSSLIVPLMPVNRSAPLRATVQMDLAPPATTLESSPTTPRTLAQAREAFGQLEMSFEANRGQTARDVNFLARGVGYTLLLKPTEAVFVLTRRSDETAQKRRTEQRVDDDTTRHARAASVAARLASPAALRMKLVGSDARAAVEGLDELAGKVNYFNGDDSKRWLTNVPTFGRVRYRDVYPGVDVIYYGNQRQLEYDFRVAPGSDARAVRLAFEGADKVEVGAQGDLLLTVGEDTIRQPKPLIYQEVAGARRAVEGGYVVERDGSVGFSVGEYDAQRPLIIDPVLVYSTYLGGSGADEGFDIALDSAGNAYICGPTNSTNFTVANPIQGVFGGGSFEGDGFVTKLNAAGTALVYSTYLGGSGDDRANKIAVDSSGNVYIAGETRSTNFPTANAFQGTSGGGFSDAFVTKLNAAGSALVYSTYLGGTIFDAAHAITIDSAGSAYLTGRTTSSDFPTVNPIQATYSGGPGADAFVTKLNAAGSALVYSTYLGGNGGNGFTAGFSIAVDSSGSAYLTGQTRATNFPTANPIQATFGGGFPDGDAFLTKLNAAGTALVYSTYLGGGDNDIGFEIALDSSGNAYVAGSTFSNNFPVANAFQNALSGTSDGFVTKVNAAGSAFAYSTYLGGTGGDSSNGIAVDSSANAYVTGGTNSTDFPLLNPTQGATGGGIDAFVTRLNAAGTALVYSTYLGGSGNDVALDIALDSAGSMYVAGRTSSTNFPTLNPVQTANGGGDNDAFVTKLSDPPPPTPTPTPTPTPIPTPTATPIPTPIPTPTPTPVAPTLQFAQATYTVSEGCQNTATITVTRTDPNVATTIATVDYSTEDNTATQKSDFTISLGTLRFAPGEAQKTFNVLITNEGFARPNKTATLMLANPTGGSLGAQSSAVLQINDDDAVNSATNPIDDTGLFVCQHYHDFLNRQSDPDGQAFWTNIINSCAPTDTACIEDRRQNVSAAFFLSIEFQQTGYKIIRIYKASFLDTPQRPRGLPRYREFLRDTQDVQRDVVVGVGNWEQQLAANMQDFARRWVESSEFVAQFPAGMTAEAFVDQLFARAEVTPTPNERAAAINAFGAGGTEGRAQALLSVTDSGSVYNKQYNPAFVLMQYIGYLRRNPNDAPDNNYVGYDFWLTKLNSFSQPGEDVRDESVALARVRRAEMVRAFLISGEYRARFGPS